MTRHPIVALSAAMTIFAGFAQGAQAAWPGKPVTIVVPFSAGGSTDNVARISAEWLAKVLKQPVNVENRAGASGTIAGRGGEVVRRLGRLNEIIKSGTPARD